MRVLILKLLLFAVLYVIAFSIRGFFTQETVGADLQILSADTVINKEISRLETTKDKDGRYIQKMKTTEGDYTYATDVTDGPDGTGYIMRIKNTKNKTYRVIGYGTQEFLTTGGWLVDPEQIEHENIASTTSR